MALSESDGNGMVLPVAPLGSTGNGGFGGDWSAWIIIFLIMAFAGWGNGFGGGYGGFGNAQLSYDFPWLMNGQNGINANTNAGFQNAAIQGAIGDLSNAVTTGFGNVATQLCGGFAGVNATVNGAQNAITQQMYANQIADMQSMNGLQSQLAQCCCDNRLATCQTQNIVQNEGNATRFADANNTRDIIDSQTKGTQAILDKLCSLELEAKNDTISQLRSELMYARGQASQDIQTAAIQAGQRALANEVEQYVAPSPRPAYIVPSPNVCSPNYGCGCGIA